jgi:hypothetical protein
VLFWLLFCSVWEVGSVLSSFWFWFWFWFLFSFGSGSGSVLVLCSGSGSTLFLPGVVALVFAFVHVRLVLHLSHKSKIYHYLWTLMQCRNYIEKLGCAKSAAAVCVKKQNAKEGRCTVTWLRQTDPQGDVLLFLFLFLFLL